MIRLLVVDPLDLSFAKTDGRSVWSTKAWFERSLRDIDGVEFDIVSSEESDLCSMALSFDGVVLGGSERNAWEDSSFNDHLLDLIAICKHSRIPFLGICFGSQLLGRALGGHVQRHPMGIELGAIQINLTDEGVDHFLFKGISNEVFHAIETHQDAVMYLPDGCRLLATSSHTTAQAFEYKELLYGVQFHPEMNAQDLRDLWMNWMQTGQVESIPAAYREIIENCQCEHLPDLMNNFVERVRLPVSKIRNFV